MPITYGWYDEAKHIWMIEFRGHWTLDDFWRMVDACYQAIDSVAPHAFYYVTVMHGSMYLPKGAFSAIQSASSQTRPNERMHVLVGGGMIVKSFFRMRNFFMPKERLELADTLEEALAMIEQVIAQDQMQQAS
ncbi:MAG: hypothetical protein NZ750_10995 [Anaerolineae bacterium]|nr:hypothetical protein [Anaerolineae bacterium]MDW8171590.1 hypothetical protein [Anaerolineae bacterium]